MADPAPDPARLLFMNVYQSVGTMGGTLLSCNESCMQDASTYENAAKQVSRLAVSRCPYCIAWHGSVVDSTCAGRRIYEPPNPCA